MHQNSVGRSSASVSAVLPVFNEELNIAATVADALQTLRKLDHGFELLIVDDGSTDGTRSVCNDLAAENPFLRVIRHPYNRGYGAALRSGFQAARCEFVFFTDADGQFRFSHLPEFVAGMAGADLVIGYRAARRDPWYRKLNSRVGNTLARVLLGVRVHDINCAYKLFPREKLQRLLLTSEGAMINTELLALAARSGWRLLEIPVQHFPRRLGKATGANLIVVWKTIREYFRLRHRIRVPR